MSGFKINRAEHFSDEFCIILHRTTHLLSFSDILQGNFKPDYYLKHIQKDLRLAISMGDSVNHPTPMAATANEVRCSIID